MQVSQLIRISGWTVLVLNLLLAWGSIAVFVRMSPAIANILERNERSLAACEQMLRCLAELEVSQQSSESLRAQFADALLRAEGNITEPGESTALETITGVEEQAFKGEENSKLQAISAIMDLATINRQAMRTADARARQLGNAGAWGIVLMALCSFAAGLLFLRAIRNQVVSPLLEIREVLVAHRNHDHFRRCSGVLQSPDIQAIYDTLNELLDDDLSNAKPPETP